MLCMFKITCIVKQRKENIVWYPLDVQSKKKREGETWAE